MPHCLYYFQRKKTRLVFWFLIIFLLVVLLLLSKDFVFRKNYKTGEVKIRNQIIKVEIADRPPLIFQGLSGRQGLADDSGMLFVFPRENIYDFWMKEMKFSLDIIWIKTRTDTDRHGQIVEIWHNAPLPQGSEIPRYHPKNPANYVLEIKAGLANKYGWQIGDTVSLNIN